MLQIRGMSIQKALVQVELSDKKAATFVKEVSRPIVYSETCKLPRVCVL